MPLIKQLTEAAISAELDHPLSSTEEPNRKNGKDSKTIQDKFRLRFELNTVRDHTGLLSHIKLPTNHGKQRG